MIKNLIIINILIIISIIGIIYNIVSYNKYYLPQRVKWYEKMSSTNKGLYLYKNLNKKSNIIKNTITNLLKKNEKKFLV